VAYGIVAFAFVEVAFYEALRDPVKLRFDAWGKSIQF
jgi:hypothetical protein